MRPTIIINQGLNYPNRKVVSTIEGADFSNIQDCITWYNNNATEAVIIDLPDTSYTCGNINITGTHNILFRGWTGITTIILDDVTAIANNPIFICTADRSSTVFENITFKALQAREGIGIEHYGYVAVEGCEFNNFYSGLNSGGELWVCNSIFNTCIRGVSCKIADIEINSFIDCNDGIMVTGGGNNTMKLQILQNVFKTNLVCISLEDYGFSTTQPSIISNNLWDLNGMFFSGFDFNTNAVNVRATNNAGVEDKKPHFKINVTGNTTAQTLVSNTWTKATFTNTESYANKVLIENNKVTILESGTKDMVMWISGTLLTSTTTATIRGVVVKNGIPASVGIMEIFLDQNNRAFNFSANAYLSNVNATGNDYFEIYLYAVGTNETITLQNLNWLGLTL